MKEMLAGAIVAGYAVAALFFLRFWRTTRDRLFALFALAFGVLTINRVGMGVYDPTGAQGDHLLWVRFCAFALILLAILDKNRSRRRAG